MKSGRLIQFFFLIICHSSFAQQIAEILHFRFEDKFDGNGKIRKIESISTFYSGSDIVKTKNVLAFTNKNFVKSKKRYDEFGKLRFKEVFTYRHDYLIVKRKSVKYLRDSKRIKNFVIFQYDNKNQLKSKKTKFGKNIIIESIINNNCGFPTKLTFFNGHLRFIENATYFKEKNQVEIETVCNGIQISKGLIKINPNDKFEDEETDLYGNIIRSKNIFMTYKYDNFDNWFEKREVENVNGTSKILSEEKRSILYR